MTSGMHVLLVPTQVHWHFEIELTDDGNGLNSYDQGYVPDDRRPETYLHFECEIFLQILDDHHQKRELDAERFLRIGRTGDVSCAHIGADDFQHQRLDVLIGDALDVPVANLFVPYLQRFASYAVQYREEPGLKSVFEHDCTTDTALFTENFHPRLIYPSKESYFSHTIFSLNKLWRPKKSSQIVLFTSRFQRYDISRVSYGNHPY